MRTLLTAILILTLAAPAAVARQQRVDPLIDSTEDPLELQQLAIQFIAGNQPRNALAALRKAIRIYPDNAESHMWLAVVYTQLEEFDAAQAAFDRALEINPQLTEAHNWYGVYWARRGEPEKAVEHYRKALEDPAYPRISRARVLVNLGNTLLQMGRVEEALPPLSEAASVSIVSNDPLYALVHLSLAEALLVSGRPDEALGALEKLEVLAANPRGELIEGLAYRDLGERGKAVDSLQRVLRLAPGSELAERALEALRELDAAPGS